MNRMILFYYQIILKSLQMYVYIWFNVQSEYIFIVRIDCWHLSAGITHAELQQDGTTHASVQLMAELTDDARSDKRLQLT